MFLKNSLNACMEWTSQNQNLSDVCALFYGSKIIRRIDDDTRADELCISVNDHNQHSYEFTVPVTVIVDYPTLLATFVGKSLALSYYMGQSLSEYLMNDYRECQQANRIEYCHTQLGWYTYRGQEYFLYDQTKIGNTLSKCTRTNFRFTSGDESKYRQFLAETVYPEPTLALALSIGYAAPVVSRLRDYADTGTIIVNLCGASSTGKTTVEQLLVSPFACPTESNKDGLIRTFHATSNAIFAGLDGVCGLPIVLDDVTTNPNIDLPNLIYTLASGEQKGRCTSEGTLRQDGNGWHGVVVISSETPIQEHFSQNQGLKVRVLQTQGITWTPDAKTAELIKRTVKGNYGFTGRDFAEFVGSIPYDELCVRFDLAQDKVHTLMPLRDGLSDRLEAKYATIYLTVELMNEFFALTLNADELLSILLQPEQDGVKDRDISLKALEVVKAFITKKHSHFTLIHDTVFRNEMDRGASGDSYGYIRVKKNCREVGILPSVLKTELKTNGINEIATVLDRWRQKGVTDCEKGRYDKQVSFGGNRQRYTVFLLQNDESPEEESPVAQVAPIECFSVENVTVKEVFGA